MNDMRKAETRLICATDIAARGLDLGDITVVINYDFPMKISDYVHRIGRTGRAGKKGNAVTFVAYEFDNPMLVK